MIKIVTFLNKRYKVPASANFIANDGDGTVYWYVHKPKAYGHSPRFWIPSDNKEEYGVAIMIDKDIPHEPTIKEI